MGKGGILSAGLSVVGLASGVGWFTPLFWKGAGLLALGQLASSSQKVEGQRLQNLGVQLAQEGAELTKGWGTWRQAGTLVYSPGLDEDSEEQSGKGGPTYIDYTYKTSVFILGGMGPITRLKRLRLNEKVYYDWNGGNELGFELTYADNHWTSNKGGRFRVYPGVDNQPVDSFLEVEKGVTLWTSYPGLWGVFIERQQLRKFGNSIPNATFEPYNAVTDLAQVVGEICSWRGYDESELDLYELEGISVAPRDDEGYVIASRKSAASAIEELGYLFNFTLRESNGVIEAIRRGRVSVAVLSNRDLLRKSSNEATPVFEERRADQSDLPLSGECNYSDVGKENNAGLRVVTRAGAFDDAKRGARGGRRDSASVTASMSGGRAARAAKIALYEKIAKSQGFPLAWGIRNIRLLAGDIITIQTPTGWKDVLLPSINQPFFGAITSGAVGHDGLLYNLPVRDDGGEWDSPLPDGDEAPIGFLCDCVALSDDRPDMVSNPGVIMAATQIAGRYWQGASVKIERQEEEGWLDFDNSPVLTAKATMGYLRASWTPQPPEAGFTEDNPVSVRMYSGELFSATLEQVHGGSNVLVFENGLVVSFVTATPGVTEGDYVLTGVKAGRWGSDYSDAGIGTPHANQVRTAEALPTNMKFLLLVDEEGTQNAAAKFHTVNKKHFNKGVRARFIPRNVDDAGESQTIESINVWRGRNTQPLSPSGLRATRTESGGLVLTGRARTRYADGNRLSEKPTITGYKYEVVLTSGAFSVPVTKYTTAEGASFNWTWTAAELAAALGRTEAEIIAAPVAGSVAMWGEYGYGRAALFSI